ncbi:MAG: hypothetical protein KDH18_02540 [Rhodoferax sp.]|nr:hypothetical protein [Rhodoferax sp.]MCW5641439.1 hypothetical protein [Rhodoferax sp.]
MDTIPGSQFPVSALEASPRLAAVSVLETDQVRAQRIHKSPGGPLMGWLLDTCNARGGNMQKMAKELGVTPGYIKQLCNGVRRTQDISAEFCKACSRYLVTPRIAVMVVAGVISLEDFIHPEETEKAAVERAMRHIANDPQMALAVPENLDALPFEAKRALALMYVETSTQDVFGLRQLPALVHWLKVAVREHGDARYVACRGAEGTSRKRTIPT